MAAFRVIIPTRDSARWIGVFLSAYRKLGVEPFYAVDARSDDATLEILRRMQADFKTFTPSGDYVESGMIEFASANAGAEWALRMDDDEFPSRRLIEWARTVTTSSLNQAWVVFRRDLFFKEGVIYWTRSVCRRGFLHAPDAVGAHLRLHQTRRVRYEGKLHSDGFEPVGLLGIAPKDAVFAHFDCLLRPADERAAKLRRYESIDPGSSWKLGDEYLPELFSLEHHLATTEGVEEFEPLLRSLPLVAEMHDPGLSDDEARTMFSRTMAHRDEKLLAIAKDPVAYVSADDIPRVFLFAPPIFAKLVGELMRTLGWGAARALGGRLCRYAKFVRGRPPARVAEIEARAGAQEA